MDENMAINWVLRYFFGIGVLIGIINTSIRYKRMTSMNQNIENDEINTFIKWHGICATIPFLLLQIFQLLGHYKTAFYIFLLDFNNPFYVLGFISI